MKIYLFFYLNFYLNFYSYEWTCWKVFFNTFWCLFVKTCITSSYQMYGCCWKNNMLLVQVLLCFCQSTKNMLFVWIMNTWEMFPSYLWACNAHVLKWTTFVFSLTSVIFPSYLRLTCDLCITCGFGLTCGLLVGYLIVAFNCVQTCSVFMVYGRLGSWSILVISSKHM